MNKLFGYYKDIQERFKFQTIKEGLVLVIGGAAMSVAEFVMMSSIFPLIVFIINPDAALSIGPLGRIYDEWGFSSHAAFTMFLIGVAVGLLFLKVLINIGLWRYEFIVLNRWRNMISHRMFKVIVKSDYQNLLQSDSSSLINIVSSVIPYIVENYLFNWIAILQTLLTAIILLALLALLSPFAMVTALIVGGGLMYIFLSVRKQKVVVLGEESDKERTKIISILQMAIAGHKDTIISRKESYFESYFNRHSAMAARIDLSLKFIQNLPGMLIEFITLSTIFLVFFVLVYITQDVQGSSLKIVILAVTGMRLIPIINRSITSITMMKSAIAPINMLIELHDRLSGTKYDPQTADTRLEKMDVDPLPFKNSITIENLNFKFGKDKDQVLRDINLTIPKGVHYGFVGASGSGKTTLMNILLTFLTNIDGKFRVDGVDVCPDNYAAYRQLIGFVDQHPFIMNGSFVENVAFGVAKDEVNYDKLKEVLGDVGLLDLAEASVHGLDSNVGENGKYLSGGQRQRLAIARALYKDAEILILDEATSALDMQSETDITSVLKRLKGKLTIISVAHRLSTLKDCDTLFFLQKGTIVSEGRFGELYERNETFRSYVDQANLNFI
ncbi:ABC transporter ATP-binding protein [Thalassospira profundimaris]|uniref:ABC transporter ATP-binding protein n=1 Tax=Thalassospira profundimaris TaxID=502049 RepID=A0A367WKZ0_9PROT|nr:ABC transporter ATP-binding protein [Thalassospira profundimaris]RCK42087.1 hypothetical protein TH30_21250 [Thalassospira profundimaris]